MRLALPVMPGVSSAADAARVLHCAGCGACCRHMALPPFGPDEDETLVPPEVMAELNVARGSDYAFDDRPCLWLGPDGRCKHHGCRPGLCRDFDPGSRACLVHRLLERVADGSEAHATAAWADEFLARRDDVGSRFGE